MVQAWYMKNITAADDPRLEHRLNDHAAVNLDALQALGIVYYHVIFKILINFYFYFCFLTILWQFQIDADTVDTSELYKKIVHDRDLNVAAALTVNRASFPDYDAKVIPIFYEVS